MEGRQPGSTKTCGLAVAEFHLAVGVPPRFCDAQGMVHAIRYHEFLEDAFVAWLASRHLSYEELLRRDLDLVIGTSTIRHRAPARLGDKLEVTCDAAGSSASTVTVDFTIARCREILAEARTTYIAVCGGRTAPLPVELSVSNGAGPD
jgi:YbgC/YbaW family acyl-CoA thioester hydrolase